MSSSKLLVFGAIALSTACLRRNDPSHLQSEGAGSEARPELLRISISSQLTEKISMNVLSERRATSNGFEYQKADLQVGNFLDSSGLAPASPASLRIPIYVDIRAGGRGSETRAATTGWGRVSLFAQARSIISLEGGAKSQPGKIHFTDPDWSVQPRTSIDYGASGLFPRIGANKARQDAEQQASAARHKVNTEGRSEIRESLQKYVGAFQPQFAEFTQSINSIAGLSPMEVGAHNQTGYFKLRSLSALTSKPSEMPIMTSSSSVGIVVHEQLIDVVGQANFAGKSFSSEQFWKDFCNAYREGLMQLCAFARPNSNFKYELIFSEQPFLAKFDNQRIHLQMRFRLKLLACLNPQVSCVGLGTTSPGLIFNIVYTRGTRVFELTEASLRVESEPSSMVENGIQGLAWWLDSQLENHLKSNLTSAIFAPSLPGIIDQGSLAVKGPQTDFNAQDGWFSSWLTYCPEGKSQDPIGLELQTLTGTTGQIANTQLVEKVRGPALKAKYLGLAVPGGAEPKSDSKGIVVGDQIYAIDGSSGLVSNSEIFSGYLRSRSMSPNHRVVKLTLARQATPPGKPLKWTYLNYELVLEPACRF